MKLMKEKQMKLSLEGLSFQTIWIQNDQVREGTSLGRISPAAALSTAVWITEQCALFIYSANIS